ncbi:MAG TPA: ferritin-like domain-containing protein, partial [Acidimicrobiales bacterium]|nr:ferritin-like domain-containing protein [Acidimicrobiales bacterium]
AAAFAGVAGDAATGDPNQALLDEFAPMIEEAEDQAALLEIAKNLEEAAASTYFFALGVLQDTENALAVASILPIESQHAVVLGQALDQETEEFVPSFETQESALTPSEYPLG